MLALTWRQLARRTEELCRLGQVSGDLDKWQREARRGHVNAISKAAASLPSGIPDDIKAQVNKWTEHVETARNNENWRTMQSLAKMADIKADKLENQARANRAADWKKALGARANTTGNKTPTRLAYRWLKGSQDGTPAQ